MQRFHHKKFVAMVMVLMFIVSTGSPGLASGLAGISDIPGGNGAGGDEAATIYFGSYYQNTSATTADEKAQLSNYTKEPIKWRVLSTNAPLDLDYKSKPTNYTGVLLLSDKALYADAYNSGDPDGTAGIWYRKSGSSEVSSEVRNTLNNTTAGSGFAGDAFNTREYAAIATTTHKLTEKNYVGSDEVNKSTEKLFLLSVEEAKNADYGFEDTDYARDSRKVETTELAENVKMYDNDKTVLSTEHRWWLRSPWASQTSFSGNTPYYITNSGKIDGAGSGSLKYNNGSFAVRPALNLDSSQILFLSSAIGGKSTVIAKEGFDLVDYNGSNGWKLTLLDSTLNTPFLGNVTGGAAPLVVGASDIASDVYGKLAWRYNGASTGTNRYVSAVLEDSTGKLVNYAKLADASSNDSGEIKIGVSDANLTGNYNMYVFGEEVHNNYWTDYASSLNKIGVIPVTYQEGKLVGMTLSGYYGGAENPVQLSGNFTLTIGKVESVLVLSDYKQQFTIAGINNKLVVGSTDTRVLGNIQLNANAKLEIENPIALYGTDNKILGALTGDDLTLKRETYATSNGKITISGAGSIANNVTIGNGGEITIENDATGGITGNVTINTGGLLVMQADKFHSAMLLDGGTVKLTGGTLNSEVKQRGNTGSLIIDGDVIANEKIYVKTTINSGKSLTIDSGNLVRETGTGEFVTNNGTFITYGNLADNLTLKNNGTVKIADNETLTLVGSRDLGRLDSEDVTVFDFNNATFDMQDSNNAQYSFMSVDKLKSDGNLKIDVSLKPSDEGGTRSNNVDRIMYDDIDGNVTITVTSINLQEGFTTHTTSGSLVKDNYLEVLQDVDTGTAGKATLAVANNKIVTKLGDYLYAFETGSTVGCLKVTEEKFDPSSLTLTKYIKGDTETARSVTTYSFDEEETLDEGVATGFDPGDTRTVYRLGMNGKVLKGSGNDGITVSKSKTLNIDGAGGTISGFATALTAYGEGTDGGGTLNLENVNFSGNTKDVKIYSGGSVTLVGTNTFSSNVENNGTLTMSGTNTFNAAITGDGTGTTTKNEKDGTVKISADNLQVILTNDGTLELNGGTLEKDVVASSGETGTIDLKKATEIAAQINNQNIKLTDDYSTVADLAYISGNNLTFNGGGFDFCDGLTKTYSVANINLAALGNLKLDVDLANEEMDTLNTSGSVTGNDKLHITALTLLSDAKQDATTIAFTTTEGLMDNVVSDVKRATYEPTRQRYKVSYNEETGEFTFTKIAEASETAKSISDTASAIGLAWLQNVNNLQKRLGDLRSGEESNTGWARFQRSVDDKNNGRKLNVSGNLYQVGYDFALKCDKNARDYLGLSIEHMDGNQSFNIGGGDIKSTSLGAYYTKIYNSGHYFDFILRYGKYDSDTTSYEDGTVTKLDYDVNAVTLSGEYGYRANFGDKGFYFEPQAEFVYGYLGGAKKTTSTGLLADIDSTNHFITRWGVALGQKVKNFNYYLRTSYYHDFAGTSRISYDEASFKQDSAQNWWEVSLGGGWNMSDTSYFYAEFTKHFKDVSNSLNFNLGFRFTL